MTDALAVRSDEGEARWWLGALAVIKTTAAERQLETARFPCEATIRSLGSTTRFT